MKTHFLTFLSLTFSATLAHSHGENKLGPNGGYIKMPGAFHTEIVPNGQNRFKVYLLDMDWKNPSISSSHVELKWNGKKQIEAKCIPQTLFYLCTFEKKLNLKSGELVVTTKRENQIGNPVSYKLPLQLEDPHDISH